MFLLSLQCDLCNLVWVGPQVSHHEVVLLAANSNDIVAELPEDGAPEDVPLHVDGRRQAVRGHRLQARRRLHRRDHDDTQFRVSDILNKLLTFWM